MDETIEWEMITTLIKKVQRNNTLSKEEKNKRVTMLFDWWEIYGKKLIRINKRLYKLKSKNKPLKISLITSQKKLYHSLKISYEGKPYSDFNLKEQNTEDIKKSLSEDELFIKNLINEIMINHKVL